MVFTLKGDFKAHKIGEAGMEVTEAKSLNASGVVLQISGLTDVKDAAYNKFKPGPTTYDIQLPHEKIFGSDGVGSTDSYWIYTDH